MDTIKSVNKAVEDMKIDIASTNTIFRDVPPDSVNNWFYYISIHANDEYALYNASILLKSLKVLAKSVTMMPRTYKSCGFDCFSVYDAFNDIHSLSSYNIDTVSVIEQTELEEGDFFISVIRENKSTKLMDIMVYKTLKYYYDLL